MEKLAIMQIRIPAVQTELINLMNVWDDEASVSPIKSDRISAAIVQPRIFRYFMVKVSFIIISIHILY